MPISLVSLLLSLAPQTGPAVIVDTICSNPSRARVLAKTTLILPSDDIDRLGKEFERLSKVIGMTTWSVGSPEKGRRESLTLGLQSPKVSVSITADWKPGQRAAALKVERTCINDDLEPWSAYWARFTRELKTRGYRLR